MQRHGWTFLIAILITGFGLCGTLTARADVCDICGKPITGSVYIVTDKVTGEEKARLFRLHQIAPVLYLRFAHQKR